MDNTICAHQTKSDVDIKKDKINHLRFIMTIFVIIIHTFNIETFSISNPIIIFIEKYISKNICAIAVPMFFCISGYLFFNNVNTMKNCLLKEKKRVFSVLVPYLVWNAIYTIVFLFIFKIPFINNIINNDDSVSLSNILSGIFLFKYSYHYWFVANLILFFVISPLLYFTLKNKIISFVALLFFFFVYIFNFNAFEIRFSLIFYFYLGAFLVKWYPNKVMNYKSNKLSQLLFLCIFLIINVISTIYDNLYINQGVILVGVICFWIIMDLFASVKVKKFELQSFFIYTIHVLILESIEKIIYLLGKSTAFAIIDYLVAPIITLTIIYLIYLLFSKLFPKIYLFINGGR